MTTLALMWFVTPLFVGLLLLLHSVVVLAVNKPDVEKLSPYECGMNPLGTAREKFSVQFFLVGILFLIFDLEVLLLFPYGAVVFNSSFYGYWIVVLFTVILTIGFIYEYSIGALKFTTNKP